MSASLWSRLGGLNTSMPRLFSAMDLGMRAAADANLVSVYVNRSTLGTAAVMGGMAGGEAAEDDMHDPELAAYFGDELGEAASARGFFDTPPPIAPEHVGRAASAPRWNFDFGYIRVTG